MVSIEFASVTVTANDRPILKDISFVFEGTRLAVLGANGSGKSTLLRLLNGLRQPSSGTVRIDGEEVSSREHRRVGFVFQNPDAQILMPTVAEDIQFGLQQWGIAAKDQTARLDQALAQFNLSHLRSQPCHSLSGGEKQRLALAAVMVLEPEVLVLDEPSTLLDLPSARDFRQRLASFEPAAVMATHDYDDLVGFDQAIVLHQGALMFQGPIDESIASYEEAVLG